MALEILTRSKQQQISLPFRSLIIASCRRARVPFVWKIDVKITPSVSTYIKRIEVEFQSDEEERLRKKLVNTTSVVYVEMLETGTSEPIHESGMPSSPTPTRSSPTPTPSSSTQPQPQAFTSRPRSLRPLFIIGPIGQIN